MGKGNHSVDHIQKIKPRVEQVCQELGLQYTTEENAGRMYINLQGGPATVPPMNQAEGQHGGFHGGNQQQGGYQQSGYSGGQQQGGNYQGDNQQDGQNDETEELLLPKILKMLDGCCVVM